MTFPMARGHPRLSGFSLLEALIVLIIAGAALMLVFAIGGQAARTGFRLGRGALAAADAEVAEDELRGLIRGLVLPPDAVDPQALGMQPFSGDARSFQADFLLDRPGLCAAAGPAGRLRVAIEPQADGDIVTCGAPASPKVIVADLRPRRARFAYSVDGVAWSDQWSTRPTWSGLRHDPAARVLYVRLASDDGRIDIVERAASGPPFLFKLPAAARP
jgi:type II secretory pathway pseudopilin PulG